jgi:hypothetical protein
MANIYTEAKGPQGVQAKESLLPTAVTGYSRGLAVSYGADAYHATLASAAGQLCAGILEEDALNLNNPCSVIEFGQAIAKIGANVSALQALSVNAAGQLIPATPGTAVLAVALESQTYVSPGSYANVFVLGLFGFLAANTVVPTFAYTHVVASDAIPVVSGTYGLGSGGALAMTLATPSSPQDGTVLTITAETAHAHTITTAGNKINGTGHVVTFHQQGDTVVLVAMAGIWNVAALVGSATLDNYTSLGPVTHLTTSTAIPVVSGTYGLGTGAALAVTLATPTAAQDGTKIYIVAETAHAHTVQVGAGIIIGATTGYATFAAIGDGIQLEAVAQKWMVKGLTGPTPVILS